MRAAYEPIYDQRYMSLYSDAPAPLRDFATYMRRAIADAEDELNARTGLRLRSDARHFLLSNMVEMVLHPVIEAGRESPDDILPMLRDDVRRVVIHAAENQPERRREQGRVTGHAILSSIDRLWDSMAVMRIEIWD